METEAILEGAIEAVFIDFDGTLVDTIPVLKNAYLAFLNQNGRVGSDAEFQELNGPTLEQIVEILRDRYTLEPSADQLLKTYLEILAHEYSRSIVALPDAENLLKELSKLKLVAVLVTSSPRSIVVPFLEKVEWRRHLAYVVTGDSVKRSKPDPEIYLQALAVSGKSAARSIGIEDSINGVRAASRAGMRVLALVDVDPTANQDFIDAGATALVNNLSQACGWIKKLSSVAD